MDTYKCPICAKSIKDYSNIIKHYQALHNKAMPKEEYMKKLTLPKCSICDKEVKTLQRHMVLVHKDQSVTDSQKMTQTFGTPSPSSIHPHPMRGEPNKSHTEMSKLVIVEHFLTGSYKGYEKYLANNNCQEYCILAVFQKWAEIRNKKSTIETYSSHMKRFFNLHNIPAGEVSFNFLAFNNKEHYIELPPPQAYANDLTQTPPTYKQFSNAYICFLKFLQASISLTPSYLMTDCLNVNKHILETRSTQALEIRNKSDMVTGGFVAVAIVTN